MNREQFDKEAEEISLVKEPILTNQAELNRLMQGVTPNYQYLSAMQNVAFKANRMCSNAQLSKGLLANVLGL